MINQQVLDYIRQQLAVGVVKENIRAALKSQGWSEQDVTEGFLANEKSVVVPAPQTVDSPSSMWAKVIPRTNKVFMIISLLLVFGLDLFIAISSPDLRSFWYMMLAVFAVFLVFFCLENFVFRKKFATTTSSLDKWISMIIVIRNLIFLLNFIPVIQLLGLELLGGFPSIILGLFGGGGLGLGTGGLGGIGIIVPVLVLLYIVLIIGRYSSTKNQ